MKRLTLAGGVLAVCVAAGCSDATEQKAREAGREAAEAAKAAGETVVSAAHDAVNNAERAGDAAKPAVNDAVDVTAAAAETAKVKSALVADSAVDASGIDVDTDAATKTILLKGHVPTATQKTMAGRIAVDKASAGYAVRNELAVRP